MGKKNRKQNNKKKKQKSSVSSTTTTNSSSNHENTDNHTPDMQTEVAVTEAVSSVEHNNQDIDGLDAIIFPGDEGQQVQTSANKVEPAAVATSTSDVVDLDTMKTVAADNASSKNPTSSEVVEPFEDKAGSSSMKIEVDDATPPDAAMIRNESSNSDLKSPTQQEGGEGNGFGGQTSTGDSSGSTGEKTESNLTTTTSSKRSSSKSPTGSAQPESKKVPEQQDLQENPNDLDINHQKISNNNDEKRMDSVDQAAKDGMSDDMDVDMAGTATDEKVMSLALHINESPPSQVSEGIDPDQNDDSSDTNNNDNKNRILSPPQPSLIEKVDSVLSTGSNDDEPNLSMEAIDEERQQEAAKRDEAATNQNEKSAADPNTENPPSDTEGIELNQDDNKSDSENDDNKKRLLSPPRPSLIEKVNSVLSTDSNDEPKVSMEPIDEQEHQSSEMMSTTTAYVTAETAIGSRIPSKEIVSNEINFTADGADADGVIIPKQGSFVGANGRTDNNSTTKIEKEGLEMNLSNSQSSWVPKPGSFVSTDSSVTPEVHQDISFNPSASDDIQSSPDFIPKPGSYVARTPSTDVGNAHEGKSDDDSDFAILSLVNSLPKEGEKRTSLVVEKEINFSPGGSDLATASPPKQGSFVGDTTLSRDRVEDSTVDTGEKLNSPKKNDEIESLIIAASINRTPSREINFCPDGSDVSSAAPPKQGSFVGGESLVRDVSIPDEPDTDFKSASVETTITGSDTNIGREPDKEITFYPDGAKTEPESASTSPPPKHGSFVGAIHDQLCEQDAKANESVPESVVGSRNKSTADEAIFIGDIYECGKGGDQNKEEARSEIPITAVTDEESDDDEGDLRAEDQLQWKAEKLQTSHESRELSGITETPEEEAAEDSEEAANNETNKPETIDKESFHPNESILAMEAMIESALNDDVFSPDEPSSEKTVVTDQKVGEGEEDIGGDTVPAVGSPAAVTGTRDMETEDMLESALSGSLGVPEQTAAETHAHDLAVVASGTDDTDDFVPDASIAEMEAAISRALDADDLALDDLMQDSPIKSPEAEKNRTVDDVILDDLMQDSPIKLPDPEKNGTVDVTDEANEALSALLDGTQYEELEIEITFDETPALESKAGPGGVVAGITNKKKSASAGSRNEKRDSAPSRGRQNVTAKTGTSRKTATKRSVGSTNPRRADRAAQKPSAHPGKKGPSRRSLLSGTFSSKSNAPNQRKDTKSVTKPAVERSKQPPKKSSLPRRSFLSGTFSSKSKSSSAEGSNQPPKKPPVPRLSFLSRSTRSASSKASIGNDEKGGRKKGSARRLVSSVTSWTKKGDSTKPNPSNESEELHAASTARQERSRPTPVQLFSDEEPDRTLVTDTEVRHEIYVEVPANTVENPKSSDTETKTDVPESQTPTSANRPFPVSPWQSSIRSVASLSSQCSVVSFTSPRKVGRFGCQGKFQPFLHDSRGPCELCVFLLSDDDKALLDMQGRHLQVMTTSGGCCKSCELFPREDDEPPVRLCRKCFHNTHRQMYRKVISKRNLLRRMGEF